MNQAGIIDSNIKIVTNGLVLNLDAAQKRSYSGSGTTWNDLSGNSNNCSLINGPTFNSANGGSIVFDGINDLINCGSILNFTSGNFSFSYWIYFNSLNTNSTGNGPVIIYKGQFSQSGYYDQISNTGYIYFLTNQSGSYQVTGTNSSVISVGNWYNICYTRNGSLIKIYLNGIMPSQTSGTHINPTSNTNNFLIASYNNGIFANVKLYNFAVYNKELSAAEIQQNYNAQKSRFGL